MIYVKTLNLWDKSIMGAIERGQIKLQRGQWLTCGEHGKKCRFVGMGLRKNKPNDTIWVVHWQGTGKKTQEKFLSSCKIYKGE